MEDCFISRKVTSEYVPMVATSYDPLKTILYTTSDGEAISPKMDNIVKSTYTGGQGMIFFNDPVTEIPADAFESIKNLTSITIPDGVTRIGNYAFTICLKLTEVTLPESITNIGTGLFFSTAAV